MIPLYLRERGGLVVNASDSGSSCRGFEPHSGQTVLRPRARHIYSPKVLEIPRKQWFRPNMTENSFTGTLRINQPTNHYINDQVVSQTFKAKFSFASYLLYLNPCHAWYYFPHVLLRIFFQFCTKLVLFSGAQIQVCV